MARYMIYYLKFIDICERYGKVYDLKSEIGFVGIYVR